MRLSPHADIADARRVDAVHGDFRTMLDEIYVDARARLLREWTWVTRDGSEYMIHCAPKPPVRAPGVEGLFFVGESTDVHAIQMDAAALSALQCAELLLADRRIRGASRTRSSLGESPGKQRTMITAALLDQQEGASPAPSRRVT